MVRALNDQPNGRSELAKGQIAFARFTATEGFQRERSAHFRWSFREVASHGAGRVERVRPDEA